MNHIVFFTPSDAECMSWTPDRYYIPGLGGAEASIVLLAPELVRFGWRVTIFNNAPYAFAYLDGVCYAHKSNLTNEWLTANKPDVFCFYRAPDPDMEVRLELFSPSTRMIAFSTDQATEGYYPTWFRHMEKIITISRYHAVYLVNKYAADEHKFVSIDLPINAVDYVEYNAAPRGHKMLWSSQPERGLTVVAQAWPIIRNYVPDAELFITASRKLWGVSYEGNSFYRQVFTQAPGVHFLSDIPRYDLVKLQKTCLLQLSSLTYEELFCVSVMEAQAAGCIPVVGSMGALPTTTMAGENVLDGHNFPERWAERVIDWCNRADTSAESRKAHWDAMARCSQGVIARQWDGLLAGLLAAS